MSEAGTGSLPTEQEWKEIVAEMEKLRAALQDIAEENAQRPLIADVYRHKARGALYEVLGDAELQASAGAEIEEGWKLTIYRGADGKLWARPADEFHDGRFEPVDAAGRA